MTAVTFDTHALVKMLRESGFDEPQAEALTKALTTAQEAQLEELATKRDLKRDLKELELDLRRELAEMKAELVKWLFGVAAAQIAVIVALFKLFS